MATLCLSNCICRFTNSRGSSSKKAQTSSASPINIPRYSKKSVCVTHLLCRPSFFRAADLALVLVQMLGNSPKEVSLSQLLQCSSLRHVNVPDIICLFTDILAQQARKRKWGSLSWTYTEIPPLTSSSTSLWSRGDNMYRTTLWDHVVFYDCF